MPRPQGILTYANGTVYKGLIVRGKRQGLGVMRLPDGAVLEGRFEDDVMVGGEYLWPDKRRFFVNEKAPPSAPQKSDASGGFGGGKRVFYQYKTTPRDEVI